MIASAKDKEIASLDTIAFLDTHVSIEKPCWQSNYIILGQILYSYLRDIDRLLYVLFFFVARYNIIRASWEAKKEILSYKKKYIEELV